MYKTLRIKVPFREKQGAGAAQAGKKGGKIFFFYFF
jgi:hypothetical protein